MRREMWFASGAVASWKTATTRSASGTAAGAPIPPRPRVVRMRIHAPGIANSANQPRPSGRCRCEWCASSCASTTFCSSSENGSSSIVSQKTTRRDGPSPYAYAFAWSVSTLTSLHADRDVPDAELAAVLLRCGHESLVAKWIRGEVEVRRDEREEGGDGDEHRGAGEPPPVSEPACEAHHDEECEADREELGSEDRPVLEQPVDVAQLALPVSPGPPVRGEAERQVDEPDDPEPQHPEEHSRSDRARRRLAREPAPRRAYSQSVSRSATWARTQSA